MVSTLIDSLGNAKPQAPRYDANGQRINDNNLEDQQTRANQVAALAAAIAGAAGLDPASATLAAQVETENNKTHPIAMKDGRIVNIADPGDKGAATVAELIRVGGIEGSPDLKKIS